MNKQEAMEVLLTIEEMYPPFELTERKERILVPNLMKMDYEGVMENLASYVMDHPDPPALNEIAAYPDDEKHTLTLMEEWKKEAKGSTPEIRKKFHDAFEKLLQKKEKQLR